MPILTQIHKRKLLLDTHVWVWLMEGKPVFKDIFLRGIEQQPSLAEILVSVISIWEVGMLIEKKRLELTMDRMSWVELALEKPGIQVAALSPSIALQSTQLPEAVHGDPADRMLIATAREQRATLVTCDQKILTFGKGKFINVFDPKG